MIRTIPLLALAALFLAGCAASDGAGPPLGTRPVEGLDLREPERTPALPAPAEPALRAELVALRGQANEGQAAFSALLPRARAASERAGAEGSEPWIAAQQLLSALEAARRPSTSALARLDALLADRLIKGQEDGSTEIQALQAEIGTMVDAQQRDLDTVRERISR